MAGSAVGELKRRKRWEGRREVGGCCCEREPEEEDKGDGITLELMGGGFVSKQDCLDPLSL